MHSYSSVTMSLANLITEIRDPSLFVDGFVQYELSQLVNYVILSVYCVHLMWCENML